MKVMTECDYHYVAPDHDEIHAKLENWARWVSVRPQPWKSQPMFANYRSHAWQWHVPEIVIPVNALEAHEVEQAISYLPEKQRTAIRWAYVFRKLHPNAVQRALSVSQHGLSELIQSGRDMLQKRFTKGIAFKLKVIYSVAHTN